MARTCGINGGECYDADNSRQGLYEEYEPEWYKGFLISGKLSKTNILLVKETIDKMIVLLGGEPYTDGSYGKPWIIAQEVRNEV